MFGLAPKACNMYQKVQVQTYPLAAQDSATYPGRHVLPENVFLLCCLKVYDFASKAQYNSCLVGQREPSQLVCQPMALECVHQWHLSVYINACIMHACGYQFSRQCLSSVQTMHMQSVKQMYNVKAMFNCVCQNQFGGDMPP